MIACRIQKEAFGNLDREAVKLLDRLARGEKSNEIFALQAVDPEGTGLRLRKERHYSCPAKRVRPCQDPAPPAFAPERGFGGDGACRRYNPKQESEMATKSQNPNRNRHCAAKPCSSNLPLRKRMS